MLAFLWIAKQEIISLVVMMKVNFLNNKLLYQNYHNCFLYFLIAAILEAQRCLSNIYLQCSSAIDFALENDTLPGIMLQTTKYKELKIPSPIISFDMKLLFLVTAQRPEARTVVVVEHRALNRLIDVLELILEKTKAKLMESLACLDDEEVSVIADVLKALFNLTCGYEDKDCDEEEESLMRRLCEIVQSLIIVSLASNDQKFKLVG
jgi:hypothetical protein